jgi:4-amino-4-deoxy-L-arabinose transferase-like glycosyltransferase
MKKNSFYQFINTHALLLIILLAFAIRMVFFVSLKPWDNEEVNKNIIVGDALEYHPLALSLLSEKSFESFGNHSTGSYRTPGYPLFVALIYGISSDSVLFVLLIQIFLSLISVVLVYKIAATVLSRQIALLSAFLFAVDITQAYWTVALYTETLFLFMFLTSIYFLCKSEKENSLLKICLSALFLGVATLIRPISFLFPLVAVSVILVLYNLKLRMKLVYSLLFCVIFVATISPWLLHNYSKYGEAKLSSISGFNLLLYNAAYTEVYRTGKTVAEVRKDFLDKAVKAGVDTTHKFSFKSSQVFSGVAKQYIKDNFMVYCKRHFMGIINMYAGLGTEKLSAVFNLKTKSFNPDHDPFGKSGIISRILTFFQSKSKAIIFIGFGLGFYLLINYLFALYGIYLLIGEKEKLLFLFILIILYFSVLTGVIGYDRYRIPFMPFINILCAVGLYHFYVKIVHKQFF